MRISLLIVEHGRLTRDGDGEPIEWVVKMHRFDQGLLAACLSGRAIQAPARRPMRKNPRMWEKC
jgi:aminoglycoside phosphotransferase family enzyme